MTKIVIYAHSAEFGSRASAFRSMTYKPFDPPLYKAIADLRNVAEVELEKQRVHDLLVAANPARSFFVDAMVVRGGRSPNGFKRLRPLEYDAALVALVDDSVAALVALGKIDPERANPVPDPTVRGARYQIVLSDHTLDLDSDQLFPALEARGFPHRGFNKSRALRGELQGRPEFDNLCGPMWGGVSPDGLPVVRYEAWAVNAALSN